MTRVTLTNSGTTGGGSTGSSAPADAARRNVEEFVPAGFTGTDFAPYVEAAIGAVAPTGGQVLLSKRYGVTRQIVVPGGVNVRGTGIDYGAVTAEPGRAAGLKALGNMASVLKLGTDPTSVASGQTAASCDDLIVDAADVAQAAIETGGRRNYIQRCQAWRGVVHAVLMNGQNGYLLDSVCGNVNKGSVVEVIGADNKVHGCQLRQGGIAQLTLRGASWEISNNHLFAGANGTVAGTTGSDINIEGGDAGRIVNNTIEGTNGSQIFLGANIEGLLIASNNFYQVNGFPDGTLPAIKLGNSGLVSALTITGNTTMIKGTGRYKAFVEKTGGGTIRGGVLVGNACIGVNALTLGWTPDSAAGNAWVNAAGVVATV